MNLEYAVSSRLKFFTEFAITYTDNDKNNEEGGNLLDIARKKMPNASVFRQDKNGNNTDVYFNIAQNTPVE